MSARWQGRMGKGAWTIPALLEGLHRGDQRALSRAISIVENRDEGAAQLVDHAFRAVSEKTIVVGITGAGGAGKSTLIDKLVGLYCAQGTRVAVLAVDPSSPFTGGAVLGDRIRLGAHSGDDNVFIRSFGSRGGAGGLSQGAKDALYLCRAFGFDLILLESLGVGQAETDIAFFSDVTLVVLAPGNGDAIQLAKAGTQEIADIFVVNKADRPEADTLYAQLTSVLETIPPESRPRVARTSAPSCQGVAELVELVQTMHKENEVRRSTKARLRIENELLTHTMQWLKPKLEDYVRGLTSDVLAGRLTPYDAVQQLERQISVSQVPLPHEEAKGT